MVFNTQGIPESLASVLSCVFLVFYFSDNNLDPIYLFVTQISS